MAGRRARAGGRSSGTMRSSFAAMYLFVFPTLAFNLLYGFIIVRLDRRELVHIAVTNSPTADWIARQITEAFPWDTAPGYLIRDRDCVFGSIVRHRVCAMGIRDKPIAPRSPWQNGFAERLIGSIRRECLDQIIVCGEEHLRRTLLSYASYYNRARTHRSLNKDAPVHRPIQRLGALRSHPVLRGLHHQYVRIRDIAVHYLSSARIFWLPELRPRKLRIDRMPRKSQLTANVNRPKQMKMFTAEFSK